MKKQGYGRFVFISSTAGMLGQHLDAHYAAAKAGLVGLTNIIALEGAPHGILANTVLPTGFSRMVTEAVGDTKALEESGFLNMIRPELVTPMVVYLASRGARAAIAITRRSVHHRFVRRGGRWAIGARICLVEWQSDATSLLSPELVQFLDSVQTVSRDTSDTSYDPPLVITRSATASP